VSVVVEPLVGAAIALGTVITVAPEVLTIDEVPVPIELIADTLTVTRVPSVSENGDEVSTDIGIVHCILVMIVEELPSQSVVSVLHINVESWIYIR
jgi:hypothetical protein